MTGKLDTPLLDSVATPLDLRKLPETALAQLADELRAETINAVSVTGGHLGAGLGVVELTVALHYVFDTPNDRIIWDVGHQAYPHKILTGRRKRIRTLRQGGGLSGFTRRAESPYDPFGAAHSSTSISAGLGMAVARDRGAGSGGFGHGLGDVEQFTERVGQGRSVMTEERQLDPAVQHAVVIQGEHGLNGVGAQVVGLQRDEQGIGGDRVVELGEHEP